MPIQHPEDILIVRNINTKDPDFADYFEVKWNGILFRIPPEGIRRMPRYLAYHFCKHLTDRVIYRMDMAQYGRKMKTSRVRDQKLRDEIQRKVIIAVDQYFMADETDPQAQLMKMYGQLNPDDKTEPLNLGRVELPLEPPSIADIAKDEMGNPILDELGVIANDSSGVGQEEVNKIPVRRSKGELKEEAEQLGIELTGKESAQDLQDAILAF